jgi:hypothetical protein
VQRVPVAGEAVEQRLVGADLLLALASGARSGGALTSLARGRDRRPSRRRPDHRAELVVGEDLAVSSVVSIAVMTTKAFLPLSKMSFTQRLVGELLP